MFDIAQEQPIRLHEAARLAGEGRGGRPINVSTVLRWVLTGVKGPGGRKVRLDGLRIGTHWVTSREALQRFAEALTPRLDDDRAATPRSAASRHRAAERAGDKLQRMGI